MSQLHDVSSVQDLTIEEQEQVVGGFKIKVKAPKVKSLGKFQQNMAAKVFGGVVGAGAGIVVTAYAGPYAGGAAGAAVSYAVGNHAQKNWTGKGLQNWNKPSRW